MFRIAHFDHQEEENQKIKQKSINEKPHKKSRENDNFEGVGDNIYI